MPKELPATLAKYGHDLTLKAYENLLNPLNRDDACETRILQILSRRRKNNPMLLGNDSELEQKIIEGVAIRVAKENADRFTNIQIVKLEVERLLNSNQIRADFNKIVEEIRSSTRPIILYIKDIHLMLSYPDKELFRDFWCALRRGEVTFICSTTWEIYQKEINVLRGSNRSFQIVLLS